MLSIYFGCLDNELRTADGWFDNQLPDEFYVTDFSKSIIKTIDNSTVINENTVDSPVLGTIPITSISSGAKGVITLMYTDKIINLVSLGDNCIGSLLEILKYKDLTVSSLRFVDFFKHGYSGTIRVLNDNSDITNSIDLFFKFKEFTRGY